jgi:hypothetical protein
MLISEMLHILYSYFGHKITTNKGLFNKKRFKYGNVSFSTSDKSIKDKFDPFSIPRPNTYLITISSF